MMRGVLQVSYLDTEAGDRSRRKKRCSEAVDPTAPTLDLVPTERMEPQCHARRARAAAKNRQNWWLSTRDSDELVEEKSS